MLLLLALACGSDPEPVAEAPGDGASAEPTAEDALVEALEEVTADAGEGMPEDAPVNFEEPEPQPEESGEAGDEGPELLPPITELEDGDFGSAEAIVHDASGAITGVRVTLAANLFVRGVPCKEGKELVAHKDGRWSCRLSDPYKVGDFSLRRGAGIVLHENGSLAEVILGDLATPAESVTVAGVPCLSAAELHANSSVSACTLARGNRFPGDVFLPAGSKVKLRDDGGLIRAEVYNEVAIRGTPYAPGTLMFEASGGVSSHQPGVFGG